MNGKVIEERFMLYTSYRDYVRIPFLFQGQYYDDENDVNRHQFQQKKTVNQFQGTTPQNYQSKLKSVSLKSQDNSF